MRVLIGSLALGVLTTAPACAPSPRSAPARPRLDKAAVYGDAALVPTREGERMRRQIALAGQLERAVATLSFVEAVTVDVDDTTEPARAVAVVRLQPGRAEDDEVTRTLAELGAALAPIEVRWVVQSHAAGDEVPSDAPPPWPLLIGLLGLGASLGVTIERWRKGGGVQAWRRRIAPRP